MNTIFIFILFLIDAATDKLEEKKKRKKIGRQADVQQSPSLLE